MMSGCDTLLMIGSGFPYSEFLPEEGQARGVQIDIDGRMVGIRYPMEVESGRRRPRDAARAAAAAERKQDRSWREEIEDERRALVGGHARSGPMVDGRARSTRSASSGSSPRGCPTTCILTADSGSAANWYARDLKLREGMVASLSGDAGDDVPGRAVRDRAPSSPTPTAR